MVDKVNLAEAFASFHDYWNPRVAGRMKMAFRDRDVIVEPGEFIIVPHGVEHCPEALDGECHVLLLEPGSTRNTGNVETDKTRKTLERVG